MVAAGDPARGAGWGGLHQRSIDTENVQRWGSQ